MHGDDLGVAETEQWLDVVVEFVIFEHHDPSYEVFKLQQF